MKGAGILAIGFFIGFFTYAAVVYLQEKENNDREE